MDQAEPWEFRNEDSNGGFVLYHPSHLERATCLATLGLGPRICRADIAAVSYFTRRLCPLQNG